MKILNPTTAIGAALFGTALFGTAMVASAETVVLNDAGAPDQTVIVEQHHPDTAMVPTAGTSGFSEGATASAAQRAFRAQDGDGDGGISQSEAEGSLAAHFAAYDINGNGSIDANEFQSWYAARGR
ncbi:MAG TPA: hypothetical protein VFG21_08880 [Xanthomonadaceae bacterium]|nr:hypothetical protein [Xanthomonadaceae bacterium]